MELVLTLLLLLAVLFGTIVYHFRAGGISAFCKYLDFHDFTEAYRNDDGKWETSCQVRNCGVVKVLHNGVWKEK